MDKDVLDLLNSHFSSVNTKLDSIGSDITELKNDMTEVKSDVTELKNNMTEVKGNVVNIKRKLDIIYDQVYNLSEFKTEVNIKLDSINENIEFLGDKILQNEKGMFVLTNKIKNISR